MVLATLAVGHGAVGLHFKMQLSVTRIATRLVGERLDAQVDVFYALGLDVGVSEDSQLLSRAVLVVDDVPAKAAYVVAPVLGLAQIAGFLLNSRPRLVAVCIVDDHASKVTGRGRGVIAKLCQFFDPTGFQRVLPNLFSMRWKAGVLGLCLLLPSWAEGGKLLDEVLKNPGYWRQMCMLPPSRPLSDLPINGYLRSWSETRISPDNFKRLRAQRAQVLAEIERRLLSLAKHPGNDSDSSPLDSYLMVLLDLNGVEALPSLLKLEKALDAQAAYRIHPELLDSQKAPRLSRHVQLLSTITALLTNEAAPGLERLGKEGRYDQEHRDQIVHVAEAFLRQVPLARFRGKAAMSAEPEFR